MSLAKKNSELLLVLQNTPTQAASELWRKLFVLYKPFFEAHKSVNLITGISNRWEELLGELSGDTGVFSEDMLYRIYSVAECFRPSFEVSDNKTALKSVSNTELETLKLSGVYLENLGHSWVAKTAKMNSTIFESTENENLFYRGGFPRELLRLYLNPGDPNNIEWNDVDVVVWGNFRNGWRRSMGRNVSPEDVLYVGNFFDIYDYFSGVDTTSNQILWGHTGLTFTAEAEQSLKEGKTSPVLGTSFSRVLYGDDLLSKEGATAYSDRLIFRHIKMLAEKRAEKVIFSTKFLGSLGHEDLVLAKRWIKRPDFPVLVQKMGYLCRMLGWGEFPETGIDEYLKKKAAEKGSFCWNYVKPSSKEWVFIKLGRLLDRLLSLPERAKFDLQQVVLDLELNCFGFVENNNETKRLRSFQNGVLGELSVNS